MGGRVGVGVRVGLGVRVGAGVRVGVAGEVGRECGLECGAAWRLRCVVSHLEGAVDLTVHVTSVGRVTARLNRVAVVKVLILEWELMEVCLDKLALVERGLLAEPVAPVDLVLVERHTRHLSIGEVTNVAQWAADAATTVENLGGGWGRGGVGGG